MNRIWAVIPAYQAEKTIGTLLTGIVPYIKLKQVIVVDDGSTDRTALRAVRAGAFTVSLDRNRGKGSALRMGFAIARELNAEWIFTLDADLQHDPAYIPDFLKLANRYDLIIGHRERTPGAMPWDRRFSNWSTSRVLSIISNHRIIDAQCGYRLIKTSILNITKLTRRRYDLETEFLLKAVHAGARIGWTPISTTYKGESSYIKRLPDTLRFLSVTMQHLLVTSWRS
ncbi:MAG: glycosyltransferase family 2 protein [Calditrichota bacterium]